ncbi:hypothetical protein OIU84_028964 [Salix udensis]|uniref:Uncharacterized protein n=1 Tax=Salix udensis TaxID=889485 RepID=A0AAD6KDS9_9ROSI|nr:hypothetical protein OIU84_028964 [Salix udensis]
MRGIQVTMHDVLRGFREVQTDSISFNDDVFGNIFRYDSIPFQTRKGDKHHEYASVLTQEELLWYQESREKWDVLGDDIYKMVQIAFTKGSFHKNKGTGYDCSYPEGRESYEFQAVSAP